MDFLVACATGPIPDWAVYEEAHNDSIKKNGANHCKQRWYSCKCLIYLYMLFLALLSLQQVSRCSCNINRLEHPTCLEWRPFFRWNNFTRVYKFRWCSASHSFFNLLFLFYFFCTSPIFCSIMWQLYLISLCLRLSSSYQWFRLLVDTALWRHHLLCF